MPFIEVSGHSFVLIGSYSPVLFHPLWFGSEEIIRPSEAVHAKIEIVSEEVTKFNTDWLAFFATRDRIIISTTQESSYEILRDFVIATFETIPHTPVYQAGINFEYHVRLPKTQSWSTLVENYAPKRLFPENFRDRQLSNLSFELLRESQEFPGKVTVQMAPSVKMEHGVYFMVNDHYQFSQPATGTSNAYDLTNAISINWVRSQEVAKEIVEKLLGESNA